MYRMYVDEVGNDDLGNVSDERHRYLSLTGLVMWQEHSRDHLTPTLTALKASVFKHDPDHPVILHRKDIVQHKGIFGILKDEKKCQEFDAGIIDCFRGTECTVITAFIDKKGMITQSHWRKEHPYHFLMEILVEKYTQLLERLDSSGDIMPEERKGKKDQELQKAFEEVRRDGTHFVNRERICFRIPSKKLKFRAKSDNSAGLQLCDLIAHPSHIDVRELQKHQVTPGIFAKKIGNYPLDAGTELSDIGGQGRSPCLRNSLSASSSPSSRPMTRAWRTSWKSGTGSATCAGLAA